jgi:hypothetical protein
MVVKILVICTLVLGAFVMLGGLPLDTFMRFWQQAFVFAVKAAIFAMIPGGFILYFIASRN